MHLAGRLPIALVPAHHRQRVVEICELGWAVVQHALAKVEYFRHVAQQKEVFVVELAERELRLPDHRTRLVRHRCSSPPARTRPDRAGRRAGSTGG